MGAAVDVKLWAGIGAGPLAWTAQLLVSYPIAQLTCHAGFASQHSPAIHVISAAALAAIAVGAGSVFRLREAGPERVQFMARLGLLSCALFAAVVIATWAPLLVLNNCEG